MVPPSGLAPEAQARLPEALAVAERLAAEWGVRIEGALPGATCSLVLAARLNDPPLPSGGEGAGGEGRRRKGGMPKVVRSRFPGREDWGEGLVLRLPLLDWERGTSSLLQTFAPHGGVAVLREDEASGAVLLPRLRPGAPLDTLPESEAVETWIRLVRRLRKAEGDAPTVGAYMGTLWTKPTELRLATDAPALARRLVETSPPPRLLHGDLHHFNVLRHGDEWVAIDPEGLVGDPAYEAAAFLRNPVPALACEPDLPGLLRRRVRRIAEGLEEPAERVWGWALVRTALCVWENADAFDGAWRVVVHALDDLREEFDSS